MRGFSIAVSRCFDQCAIDVLRLQSISNRAAIGMRDLKVGKSDRAAAAFFIANIGQQFVLYGLDK